MLVLCARYVKKWKHGTGGDLPGTTVYASANKTSAEISSSWTDYDFIFDSPASVTASSKYSIVIKTSNGDADNEYRVRHMKSNVYSGGRRVQSNDGSSWSGTNQDTYFITRVNVGALPGSTVYASTSRSDITTAGDYNFFI